MRQAYRTDYRSVNATVSSANQNRTPHIRLLAEQAFSRAAGAPLLAGNALTLLRDATENYPAWEAAILGAEHHIHFENYIFADDPIGRRFVDLLAAKARAGVRVRIIYDWLGCLGKSRGRLWSPLLAAGGEVRGFNPPQLGSPFAWTSRDHRKSLSVDGRLAFVSGLCLSQSWCGNAQRGLPPWRDTGVMVSGPAVADISQAFAQVWASCGPALPDDELRHPATEAAGQVNLRVIATSPSTSGLYRLDQLIAAVARQTLWLTDPYYMATPAYMHALSAAAQDGVDVRLLVPSSTDIPALSPLSRAGYQPLVEAGVRVFEWNGPMIHAKTAVADGRWARVGSSNLNIASWINNYELDLAIEDGDVARQMQAMYEQDLSNATEVVLSARRRVTLSRERPQHHAGGKRDSASRTTAAALRLSNTMAASMQQQRVLGPAEATLSWILGLLLLAFALITFYWPRLVALPLGLFSLWLAISFLLRSRRMLRHHRRHLAVILRRRRQARHSKPRTKESP